MFVTIQPAVPLARTPFIRPPISERDNAIELFQVLTALRVKVTPSLETFVTVAPVAVPPVKLTLSLTLNLFALASERVNVLEVESAVPENAVLDLGAYVQATTDLEAQSTSNVAAAWNTPPAKVVAPILYSLSDFGSLKSLATTFNTV